MVIYVLDNQRRELHVLNDSLSFMDPSIQKKHADLIAKKNIISILSSNQNALFTITDPNYV